MNKFSCLPIVCPIPESKPCALLAEPHVQLVGSYFHVNQLYSELHELLPKSIRREAAKIFLQINLFCTDERLQTSTGLPFKNLAVAKNEYWQPL